MGRRRVEIKRIEDKSKRQTSFTKRRNGLMKKAGDYVDKFGGEVAFIAFSNAGNCFGYGNPSLISVVNRYLALTAADAPENNNNQEYSDPVAGLGGEYSDPVAGLGDDESDDDLKTESEIGENSTDESEAENPARAEREEEEEEMEKKRRQRAMWEKAIEDSNIGELERWKAHLEEVKLKLEKILESKS
ncbi:hypothetical protein LguiB_028941 [Lonicera macranthoides]